MKAPFLFVIILMLSSLLGWAQQPSGLSTRTAQASSVSQSNSSPVTSGNNHQANPSSTQVSTAMHSGSSAPSPAYSPPQSIADRHPARGKSHYSCNRSTQFDPTNLIIKDMGPVKIMYAIQTIQSTPHANPPYIPATASEKKEVDQTLVLNTEAHPVVFYRNNHRISSFKVLGVYGVQIGYYKSYQEARKDLQKYRSRFNVAGFICEDNNLMSSRNVEERPFRLIFGYFHHKSTALRLFHRLQQYFPFCFIVKYA